MNSDDIGMVKRRSRTRFLREAAGAIAIFGELAT
jgi:hypothetical protein